MMNSKLMLSLLSIMTTLTITSLSAHDRGQDHSRDQRDRDYYNLYWQNKQNIRNDRINRNETTDHIPYYQTEWYEENQ